MAPSANFLNNPEYSGLRTAGVIAIFAFLGVFIFMNGLNQKRDGNGAQVYGNQDVISRKIDVPIQVVGVESALGNSDSCFVRFSGKTVFWKPCSFAPGSRVILSTSPDPKIDPLAIIAGYDWNKVQKQDAVFNVVAIKSALPSGCFVTVVQSKIKDDTRYLESCPFTISALQK